MLTFDQLLSGVAAEESARRRNPAIDVAVSAHAFGYSGAHVALIAALSLHFNARIPSIKLSARGGRYFGKRNPPVIIHDDSLCTIVHEFAHHLEYSRNNGRRAERMSHGPAFVRALVDTIDLTYPARDHYPWALEYKRVRAIYTKRYLQKEEACSHS